MLAGSASRLAAHYARPLAERSLDALRSLGRRTEAGDPRVVKDAAATLVSSLFFAPLLAEMRKLPFGRTLGNGGRGEEVFGEQLDLRIADAVASAESGGLTAQLMDRLDGAPPAAGDGRRPVAAPGSISERSPQR
jgi:hypothetical protein